MVAKIKRNTHCDSTFEAQAIKISGGSNPSSVSEIKKKTKTVAVSKLIISLFSKVLMSIKKYSNPKMSAKKIEVTQSALLAVDFRNG